MKYQQLALDIIKNVGGKDNISSLTHCVTRLRFKLKDEGKANTDILKNMDGVVTVMQAGGQYQVVIGNHVPQVYEAVVAEAGIATAAAEETGEKQSFFNKLIDIISGCFQPFVGVLAATGMIKGVDSLLQAFGVLEVGSGTQTMIAAIGDSVFYFMPLIIAVTAARKFKVNEFVGLALGASLMYPTMQEAIPGATIFGIPFVAQSYASSVVPIIFIVLLASYVQKFVKKIVPEIIAAFFVPMLVLLITMPIAFLAVGPILTEATSLLNGGFDWLYNLSPIAFGIILGFFWQILVIFGLHWAIVPMMILQIGEFGFSTISGTVNVISFAQTAVVIALFFKIKDQKFRGIAIPAMISGFFGVTEPAIYGVTLPRKSAFIMSCIGAAIGGLYGGIVNLKSYSMGGFGVFATTTYLNPNGGMSDVINFFVAIAIAMVSAFALTMIFYKEPTKKETITDAPKAPEAKDIRIQVISNPVNGSVRPLAEAADKVFAEGHMGQGVVVDPHDGEVRAPFTGTVTAIFPTKHAIGLTSEAGVEMLIHVGMDTVSLGGKGFEAFVEQGDTVKEGQLLLKFNLDTIKEAGLKTETPIIITNSANFKEIEKKTGILGFGKELFTIQ